jgi:thiol-disulfide isomerase/thioredoxin
VILKFYRSIFAVVLIIFTISAFGTRVFAATDLKLNPNLNYSSDSNDGPLITGKNMSDGTINKGKPVYVIFYHRECYNSKRQARRTVELYEKYNGRVDFIVVDLDSSRSSEQSSLLKSHYKNYIPHITIFSKEGKVVHDKSGEVRNSRMSEILDGLL